MSNKPDHQSRGHAEFSPSSLKYVAACAAYEGRSGTSAAAEMGTRIHEALEVFDPSALHNEEELAIYEQIVKMEQDFMTNFAPIKEELNEIQVDIDLYGVETYGTCDRFLILEDGNAVMADYKTGISIIDPPEKNWQAKAYVVGAFQKFEDIDQITFAFYVPQHNATLHHVFNRSDLTRLIVELHDVIRDGQRIRPKWESDQPELHECHPNQNCRFCKHEDTCPALGYLAVGAARKLEPTIQDIDPYAYDDPEHMPTLFNVAKIVEEWAKTVKNKAKKHLQKGGELAGLSLRSMGKSRSITSNSILLKIAEDYGLDRDDLIEMASLPLSRIAKKVSANEEKGKRAEKEQKFLATCEDAGIVEISEERYSVVSK